MPELKRSFQSGRMNKDLDERLVPKGEYRDALNVEVSTSEGSDTGSLQTVMGNTSISLPFPTTHTLTSSAYTVGSIANDKNDKLYWLVADAGSNTSPFSQYGDFYKADVILEYDWTSNSVNPVFIDVYHTSCNITGVTSPSSTDPNYWLTLTSTLWTTGTDMDYTIYPGMEVQVLDTTTGASMFPIGTLVKAICPNTLSVALDNIPPPPTVISSPFSNYQVRFINPKRVLNFSRSNPITGINIIDDMLFWTDNFSEPKKIDIGLSKKGSAASWINHAQNNWDPTTNTYGILDPACGAIGTAAPFGHTRLQQIDSSPGNPPNSYIDYGPTNEEHVTVIRRSPPSAPVLEMKNTQKVGEVNAWISQPQNPFIDVDGEIQPSSTTITGLSFVEVDLSTCSSPAFSQGDYLDVILQGSEPEIKIRLQVMAITIGISPACNTYDVVVIASDDGANSNGGDEVWEVKLEDIDPLFQFKFPRFATRYKYDNGEYSAFSPFTGVGFLPTKFDYLPKEGYNLGMVNQLRSLVIKDFVHERLLPEDVIAIDILYKESNSPNVYSIKTIKRIPLNLTRWDPWNATSVSNVEDLKTRGFLTITSEMIHAMLPSNQLLRPWDNVPRKALAQEVTGNRLVYGNYLQNYNLENSSKQESNIDVEIDISIEHREVGNLAPEEIDPKYAWQRSTSLNDWGGYGPAKSIKTLRTYQIGVIYIDDYGRETPVFSKIKSGKMLGGSDEVLIPSIYLEKKWADRSNKLTARITSTVPEWAKAFKFFIKETSNEYYNLAMDRWYDAEDGNIWLSFPSSERNKVDEETFLILKKEHDSNKFVPDPARYKIIAIENEAPTYIKTYPKNQGIFQDDGNGDLIGAVGPVGWPQPGGALLWINTLQAESQCKWWDISATGSPGKLEGDTSDFWFRFRSTTTFSKWYRIDEVKLVSGGAFLQIIPREKFGSELVMMGPSYALRNTGIEIEMVERVPKEKPEFEGRFFAKIRKDLGLQGTILKKPIGFEFLTSSSGSSCYVNPQSIWALRTSTGWPYGDNAGGGGATGLGFGYSRRSISISNDQNMPEGGGVNATGRLGNNVNFRNGNGQNFWEHISPPDTGSTGFIGIQPVRQTGWFIDKVEGFRNFAFIEYYWPKQHAGSWATKCALPDRGVTKWWSAAAGGGPVCEWNCGGALACYNMTYPYWHGNVGSSNFSDRPLLLMATNTYNNISDPALGSPYTRDYLDVSRNRNYLGTNLASLESTASSALRGGQIVPSIGIDGTSTNTTWPNPITGYGVPGTGTNVIHLSYAGIGLSEPWTQQSCPNIGALMNDFSYWLTALPAMQAEDYFITSITNPGAVWRWAEDPGVQAPDGSWHPVIYQTLKWDATTGQSQVLWNTNTNDFIDTFRGISLYNYTSFMDYGVYHHHKGQHSNPANAHNWNITGWDTSTLSDHSGSNDHRECHLKHQLTNSGGYPKCEGTYCMASVSNPTSYLEHQLYPRLLHHWERHYARRRRYQFYARALNHQDTANPSLKAGLGGVGPHYYLPTNDPDNPPHFDVNGEVVTTNPITGTAFGRFGTDSDKGAAPGIRSDGMFCGAVIPNWTFDESNATPAGSSTQIYDTVPPIKRWDVAADDANWGDGTLSPGQTPVASGCVTWEVLDTYLGSESEKSSSNNPAIWETEPKEDVGLDIYHEIGQIYPTELNDDTIEQFVGAIHDDPSILLTPLALENAGSRYTSNSQVTCWRAGSGFIAIDTDSGSAAPTQPLTPEVSQDIRVVGARDNIVMLADINGNPLDGAPAAPPIMGVQVTPIVGDVLSFFRADSGMTEASVIAISGNEYELSVNVHNKKVHLPWFNCYSFGNGVESDRVRDDYNQVTIDNGPKASTTLEEPYLEERRGSGFIWSGIYNSNSGINNLNQFIQAEKITKDLNPIYGTIQKLHQRDTDLLTLCEDKVFKVVSHKDALYKADGNPQLTATDKVLGQTTPFVGEYGISKDPESFASESFRFYFSDRTRGAVLRLSQNGITPISDVGMRDWFSDKLKVASKILGTFDSYKNSYNITIHDPEKLSRAGGPETLSYIENVKGWSSFKSFIPEEGESLNNNYYTFYEGRIWKHHSNIIRNNFYGIGNNSSVKVLFNDAPGSVKSFGGLNYEGTQARITFDNNNPDYYDNPIDKTTLAPISKLGWYVDLITTNLQTGNSLEFKNKEDKWFSEIKGEETVWLDDGTAGNVDPQEFSVQGIGLDCCVEFWAQGNTIQSGTCCIPDPCCDDPNATNFGSNCYLNPCGDVTIGDFNQMWINGGSQVWSSTASYTGSWLNIPVVGSTTAMWWYPTELVEWPAASGNIYFARHPNIPVPVGEIPGSPTPSVTSGGLYPYWQPASISYNQGTVTLNECCIFPGCPMGSQTTFDPYANIDDGSCIPIIYGCTDDGSDPNFPGRPTYMTLNVPALNWYSAAFVDDGSCIYPPCPPTVCGCMDPAASNYCPTCTIDDGSCPPCSPTIGTCAGRTSFYPNLVTGGGPIHLLQLISDDPSLHNTSVNDIYAEMTMPPTPWAPQGNTCPDPLGTPTNQPGDCCRGVNGNILGFIDGPFHFAYSTPACIGPCPPTGNINSGCNDGCVGLPNTIPGLNVNGYLTWNDLLVDILALGIPPHSYLPPPTMGMGAYDTHYILEWWVHYQHGHTWYYPWTACMGVTFCADLGLCDCSCTPNII